jgi:hypothetical protein
VALQPFSGAADSLLTMLSGGLAEDTGRGKRAPTENALGVAIQGTPSGVPFF